MPELVDLASIGLWSTAACVQLGMAIFDNWKSRNLTSYQRVVKGEKINGWRVLVPAEILYSKHKRCNYCFVCPSWSMLDEDGTDLGKLNKFSMLVRFTHTSPDGRRVFFICRYSLINPEVHAPIIQLVYDPNQWSATPECFYLTDRTVVLTMMQVDTQFIRLILVDVITRSYRMFMLEAPEADTELLIVTTGNTKEPRLIVHLARTTMQNLDEDEDILWQREFIDASYELPTSSTDVPIKPTSWQSLVIPLGERLSVWMNTIMHYPPLIVMYKDGATNLVDYQCLVFCNGSWRLENLMTWLTSFRASIFNTKWLNALNAFGELSPPDDWGWCEIQTLRYSPRILGFTIDGAVFCATNFGGIHVRSIDPPSLLWLAAVAFCKAYPEYKLEDLLEAIGFDMFDGIFGHSEADAPLIYL